MPRLALLLRFRYVAGEYKIVCAKCRAVIDPGPPDWQGRPLAAICETCRLAAPGGFRPLSFWSKKEAVASLSFEP